MTQFRKLSATLWLLVLAQRRGSLAPVSPGPMLNNDLVTDLVRQFIEVLQPLNYQDRVATAVSAAIMDSVMAKPKA